MRLQNLAMDMKHLGEEEGLEEEEVKVQIPYTSTLLPVVGFHWSEEDGCIILETETD